MTTERDEPLYVGAYHPSTGRIHQLENASAGPTPTIDHLRRLLQEERRKSAEAIGELERLRTKLDLVEGRFKAARTELTALRLAAGEVEKGRRDISWREGKARNAESQVEYASALLEEVRRREQRVQDLERKEADRRGLRADVAALRSQLREAKRTASKRLREASLRLRTKLKEANRTGRALSRENDQLRQELKRRAAPPLAKESGIAEAAGTTRERPGLR